jgi:ABC-2 type transport system permease protein
MNRPAASLMRMRGLLRKEILQVRRDPSSILLALVRPVFLIFIFGYGLSLNPTMVPVAIVSDDHSDDARQLTSRFDLSPYFSPSSRRFPGSGRGLAGSGTGRCHYPSAR